MFCEEGAMIGRKKISLKILFIKITFLILYFNLMIGDISCYFGGPIPHANLFDHLKTNKYILNIERY